MAGTLVANTINTDTGVFTTNNAITGIAKAWVNFAGASGTVNASFNVSSVTRSATGTYVVNFTTALANTNFSTASSFVLGAGNAAVIYENSAVARTTSSYSLCVNSSGTAFDPPYVSTTVFAS